MTQTHVIMVFHIAIHNPVIHRRQNLPVVIRVVMRVPGNLLALAGDTPVIVSKGIPGVVAVKKDFGLLVLDCDGVVVLDFERICEHNVVAESLLKLRGHEIVARSGSCQDGEVYLEPKEVEDERHDYEAECPGDEVFGKLAEGKRTVLAVDVEETPKVDDDGRPNGDKGKKADVLC